MLCGEYKNNEDSCQVRPPLREASNASIASHSTTSASMFVAPSPRRRLYFLLLSSRTRNPSISRVKLQLAVLFDFSVVTQQRPYLHFSDDCDFRPVVIVGGLDFPQRPAGRCSSHFRPRHHGNRMISNVHLTCSRSMVMAFSPCLASPRPK